MESWNTWPFLCCFSVFKMCPFLCHRNVLPLFCFKIITIYINPNQSNYNIKNVFFKLWWIFPFFLSCESWLQGLLWRALEWREKGLFLPVAGVSRHSDARDTDGRPQNFSVRLVQEELGKCSVVFRALQTGTWTLVALRSCCFCHNGHVCCGTAGPGLSSPPFPVLVFLVLTAL